MNIVVSEYIDRPQNKVYSLKDGTIIKLSWNNPARVQGETFSVGQVINFLPEDILDKSDIFSEIYKNIGKELAKPYKVQTAEGEDEKEDNDLVDSNYIVYQGIIDSVLILPKELDTLCSLNLVRYTTANENLYLDKLIPFLIYKCLK